MIVHENRPCYTRLLKALHNIKVGPGEVLQRRQLHRAIVEEFGLLKEDRNHVTDEDLKGLYLDVLRSCGIYVKRVGEEDSKVIVPDGYSTVYPVFNQTRSFIQCYDRARPKETENRLRELEKKVRHELETMGFLDSYARIYVTDDMWRLCKDLDFLILSIDVGDHPAIGTQVVRSLSGEFPMPILLVEWRDRPLPLTACLLHEVLHVVTEYAWDLDVIRDREILTEWLGVSLLVEAFIHSTAASILGRAYLATAVSLLQFHDGEQGGVREGLGENEEVTSFFLATFPWVAAVRLWTPESGEDAWWARVARAWPPEMYQLAGKLQILVEDLYRHAVLSSEMVEQVSQLLSASEMGGSRFREYILARMARFFQRD